MTCFVNSQPADYHTFAFLVGIQSEDDTFNFLVRYQTADDPTFAFLRRSQPVDDYTLVFLVDSQSVQVDPYKVGSYLTGQSWPTRNLF